MTVLPSWLYQCKGKSIAHLSDAEYVAYDECRVIRLLVLRRALAIVALSKLYSHHTISLQGHFNGFGLFQRVIKPSGCSIITVSHKISYTRGKATTCSLVEYECKSLCLICSWFAKPLQIHIYVEQNVHCAVNSSWWDWIYILLPPVEKLKRWHSEGCTCICLCVHAQELRVSVHTLPSGGAAWLALFEHLRWPKSITHSCEPKMKDEIFFLIDWEIWAKWKTLCSLHWKLSKKKPKHFGKILLYLKKSPAGRQFRCTSVAANH